MYDTSDSEKLARKCSFIQNRECEYFPCHKTGDPEHFSCLFCYCPLYALGDKCGGNFTYSKNGYKNCTNCTFPHKHENYPEMLRKLGEVMKMTKIDPSDPRCEKCSKTEYKTSDKNKK